MNALRRTLYLQAAVWGLVGAALAVAPRLVLVSLFGQPPLNEPAWVRLLGIHAVAVAMLMVLVAHRIEDLWWWAWGFCLVTAGVAVVTLINAAFGLAPGEPATLWWVFAGVTSAFAFALLYGLAVTATQNPIQ